jgi:branched-chain amino acid aminotransferase
MKAGMTPEGETIDLISVFEGVGAYSAGKIDERLFDSARVFGFREFPWSVADIVDATKQVVKSNGFKDCYIRPLLYLDNGGWNLNVDNGKPSLAIAAWEWGNYLGEEALAKGIRANIGSLGIAVILYADHTDFTELRRKSL